MINFTQWDKVRVPYCVGSENGAQPTWVQTYINNRVYSVQVGTTELECRTGMLALISSDLLTADFIMATVIGSIISQIQPLIPIWDVLTNGRLPSGVTEINADLATMKDGTTGRCLYCTLVMYLDEPWVPVFLYTRFSATAVLTVDVSGNGMPDEQYVKTIPNAAGISLSFPEFYPERFVGVGMVWSMLNSPENFVYDVPFSEMPTGSALLREGTPLYIDAPTEDGINVTIWENRNHAKFDHNSASVGVDRDIAPTELDVIAGKFQCSANPPITTPAVTTPSLCLQMEDGGWIEEGTFNDPYATDVIVILQPESSSYVATTGIPGGTFVLGIGTACPVVTASPRQERGAQAHFENGGNLTINVFVETFGTCSVPDELILIGSKSVIQRTYPVCVDGISVSRETAPAVFEFCANTSFTDINAIAPVQIGIYNQQLDATYSQKLTTTMTDDIMVSTAQLSLDLAALQSDALQLMMLTLVETIGVRVNSTYVSAMNELLDRASALAEQTNRDQENNRYSANFTFTDTTDLVDKLRNISAETDEFIANRTAFQEEFDRINAEAAAKLEDILNLTEVVKLAEQEFLESINETSQILVEVANGIINVLEGQQLDWDEVGSLLVAAGEGVESLGDFLIDAINAAGGFLFGGISGLANTILTFVGIGIAVAAVIAVVYVMVKSGMCSSKPTPKSGTSARWSHRYQQVQRRT